MEIVLVHGIWDTGRVFRRMAAHLSEQEHRCFTPDLLPANGAGGLVDLAQKLESYIAENLKPEPFALVGFSMGSLICRYYLQCLGGQGGVSHFFSISGPHRGTLTAHFWPGKAARDMRYHSRFIREMNANLSALNKVRTKTYRTPYDLLVIPSRSSKLPDAEDRVCHAAFHHRMLCHQTVIEDIAATLR